MFVDKVTISVKAGKGGDGCVSFHREKFVAAGGPDGGDGGKGGNIILLADNNMSTLMDFRYKRKYVAENGGNGENRRSSGKDGQDLIIKVPVGTVVRDAESGAVIHDISDEQPLFLAKGGRGGWGNKHFATPTRQVPRFAKPGLNGEARLIVLELKLLADVGLVGFPNVGKSTLLAAASNARPKIANYHFTTLYPNLGVVFADEGASFVMADIPGIIEGASQGAGLGHDFLRHIDRCRLLVHLIDISGCEGRDPVEDFNAINSELAGYSAELAKRPQIVVGNKADITSDHAGADRLKALVEDLGYDYYEISAATGDNVRALIWKIWEKLSKLPPITVYEADYVVPLPLAGQAEDVEIQVEDGNTYILSGPWLERLVAGTNFGDYESRMHFDKQLRGSGIFQRLEDMGIKDGETVSIYNLEFEYLR